MHPVIQEIQAYQNRIRAFERLTAAMALKLDELYFEIEDLSALLAEVLAQRDLAIQARNEAQDLLTDLQREKVPA